MDDEGIIMIKSQHQQQQQQHYARQQQQHYPQDQNMISPRRCCNNNNYVDAFDNDGSAINDIPRLRHVVVVSDDDETVCEQHMDDEKRNELLFVDGLLQTKQSHSVVVTKPTPLLDETIRIVEEEEEGNEVHQKETYDEDSTSNDNQAPIVTNKNQSIVSQNEQLRILHDHRSNFCHHPPCSTITTKNSKRNYDIETSSGRRSPSASPHYIENNNHDYNDDEIIDVLAVMQLFEFDNNTYDDERNGIIQEVEGTAAVEAAAAKTTTTTIEEEYSDRSNNISWFDSKKHIVESPVQYSRDDDVIESDLKVKDLSVTTPIESLSIRIDHQHNGDDDDAPITIPVECFQLDISQVTSATIENKTNERSNLTTNRESLHYDSDCYIQESDDEPTELTITNDGDGDDDDDNDDDDHSLHSNQDVDEYNHDHMDDFSIPPSDEIEVQELLDDITMHNNFSSSNNSNWSSNSRRYSDHEQRHSELEEDDVASVHSHHASFVSAMMQLMFMAVHGRNNHHEGNMGYNINIGDMENMLRWHMMDFLSGDDDDDEDTIPDDGLSIEEELCPYDLDNDDNNSVNSHIDDSDDDDDDDNDSSLNDYLNDSRDSSSNNCGDLRVRLLLGHPSSSSSNGTNSTSGQQQQRGASYTTNPYNCNNYRVSYLLPLNDDSSMSSGNNSDGHSSSSSSCDCKDGDDDDSDSSCNSVEYSYGDEGEDDDDDSSSDSDNIDSHDDDDDDDDDSDDSSCDSKIDSLVEDEEDDHPSSSRANNNFIVNNHSIFGQYGILINDDDSSDDDTTDDDKDDDDDHPSWSRVDNSVVNLHSNFGQYGILIDDDDSDSDDTTDEDKDDDEDSDD